MTSTELLDRPERITVGFIADTSDEAVTLAKAWARAEPNIRIKTICSVRREGAYGRWQVELAVRWLA